MVKECHETGGFFSAIHFSIPLCEQAAELWPNSEFPQDFQRISSMYNGHSVFEEVCPCHNVGQGLPMYIYYVSHNAQSTQSMGYWNMGNTLGTVGGILYKMTNSEFFPLIGWMESCPNEPRALPTKTLLSHSIPACRLAADLWPNGDFPQDFQRISSMHNGHSVFEEVCPCHNVGQGLPMYIYYVIHNTSTVGYWNMGSTLGAVDGILYKLTNADFFPLIGWMESCPNEPWALPTKTVLSHICSLCSLQNMYLSPQNLCFQCPSVYSAIALTTAFSTGLSQMHCMNLLPSLSVNKTQTNTSVYS